MRRVNWSITTRTQWVLKVADSHRNKSATPQTVFRVAEEMSARMDLLNPTPAGSERAQNTAQPHPYRSRYPKPTPSAGQCADSSTGIALLRMATTASMSSLFRSLLAGTRPVHGREINRRYFRFLSSLCRGSKVEGLQDDGGTEDACPAHQEAEQTGGEAIHGACRLGARWRPRLRHSAADGGSTRGLRQPHGTESPRPPASRTTVTIT